MSLGGVADDAEPLFAVAQLPNGAGVLVAPRRVLTAAHCLRGPRATVRFRSASAWSAPYAGDARAHPDYALPLGDDGRVAAASLDALGPDLALVDLDEAPHVDGVPVRPLALGDGRAGDRVSLVGYGADAPGGALGYVRRRGDAIVTRAWARHYALDARDGAVMTAGDSGGALVRADGAGGYVVVGVASLYAEARWSLCVRVAPYAEWIRRATSPA